MWHLLKHRSPVLVFVMLCAIIACRDESSPERYNYNLGTSEQPLMPIPLPNRDAGILTGRATLVPIAELSESEPDEPELDESEPDKLPPEDADEDAPPDAEAGAGDSDGSNGKPSAISDQPSGTAH